MTRFKSPAMLLGMALLGSGGMAQTARAALPVGATAPDFQLQAARGGQAMAFSLQQALQRGPVVLYFFPAAFTRAARSRRTISRTRPMRSTRWGRP